MPIQILYSHQSGWQAWIKMVAGGDKDAGGQYK